MKGPVSPIAVVCLLLLGLPAENNHALSQETSDSRVHATLIGTWRMFPKPQEIEEHDLELSRFIWRTAEFGHLCNFGSFAWTFSSDGTAETEAVSVACRGYGGDDGVDILIGSDAWTETYAYEFENGVLETRPDYEPASGTSCQVNFLGENLMFMSDCQDFVDQQDGTREWRGTQDDRLFWKSGSDGGN